MKIRGYGYSVVGGREMNQDSFLISDPKKLYAVADGVGGGMNGEIASDMAVKGLDELVTDPNERLTSVFKQLQKRIFDKAMSEFGEPLMGTTLSVVRLTEAGEMTVCHAGDSRCYLFSQSLLRQLTEDHEFFDERIQGTVLSSYLGLPEDVHPLTVTEQNLTVVPGDRVLLCSDGLYRQIPEPRLAEMFREKTNDLTTLVKDLCEEAARKEYSDNVTVIIVEVEAD